MIKTNKDKLIVLAVQGEIMPAQVERLYTSTWDGRSKICIGVGGINYNLKIGDKIFGWANGDRARPGVCTDNTGSAGQKTSYRRNTSLGNEAKMLSGDAKDLKGVIIGKHSSHTLLHFDDDVLDKLAIGDKLLIKARGIGLKIEGHEEIMLRSVGPKLLESMGIEDLGDKLAVPVVKELPHFLTGEGLGTAAHNGHIGIQTCYPPDIPKYGLDELRFGDLVLLKDFLSDFGKQYYRGGGVVGVVVSGPSDVSGQGIGVTTILSDKNGKLTPKIDPEANIGRYLGLIGG